MNRPSGRVAVVLAAACLSLLAGCPVPIPPLGYSSTSRDNLPDRLPAFVVEGRTTREDVLLGLGAPDAHSADGHWFAYRSERHTGGIIFMVASGYSAGGAGAVGYEERLLTLRFDERGIVLEATLENRLCPRGVVAFGGAGGGSSPCLKLPDLAGAPSPELSALRTVHVVKGEDAAAPDLDRLLVSGLRRRGLEASAGPADQAPAQVDAVLTYRAVSTAASAGRIDRLTVLLQAPGAPKALAMASAPAAGRATASAEDMVAEVLASIFTGAARPFLTLPSYKPAPQPSPSAPADRITGRVEPVRDARGAPRGRFIGERTALGVSLGMIDVAPLPVEIVGQVLREELALLGLQDEATGGELVIDAQLTKFEVRTPSTLVYWDVIGAVAVDLGVTRSAGARRELRFEATCVERTYVALSETMIRGVVQKCIDGLGAKLRGDPALARLLGGK